MDSLVIVGALVVSAILGWPAVEGILAITRVVPEAEEPASRVLEPKAPPERHALRGGAVIGVLERLSITGLIIVGQAGLIAVVIAIKSLGRLGELRGDPVVGERFIIGSLASSLWAGLSGFGALQIIA